MRKIYLSFLILAGLVITFSAEAQIKIGTNGATIAPSSLLELESANQGLLLPRMADTVAINALNPPNGMLIYLTKAPAVGLYVRKVTGWEYLTGSLGGNGNFASLTVSGTVTAGSFSGPLNGNATSANTAINATNSLNSTVVNDLATALPVYPTFVNTTPGNAQLRTSTTKLSFVPNTGILSATGFNGPLVGNVTGNATSADNAINASNTDITNDVVSPVVHYPTFVEGTSGNHPQKTSAPGLNYVPSTGTLSAVRFSGPLTGNATSATTAVNATNSANSAITNDVITPTVNYPVFVGSSTGNQPLRTGNANLTYVPSTGQLSATRFVGNLTGDVTGTATASTDAQNTVNMRVTDDVLTTTTVYPTFVTGTSGPLPPFVSSTRLSFIPSTGELTAPIFRGDLQGNASSATTITGNVPAINGGTGQSIYTPGDMLYANTSTTLAKLPIGVPGTVLRVSPGNIPAWSTAGAGTVINVSGVANRISVTDPTVSPIVDISANYVGQTSINTVGTIINGTWNAGVINSQYGGLGSPGFAIGAIPIGAGLGNNLTTLPQGNAGEVLVSNGAGFAPSFQFRAAGDMVTTGVQDVTGAKTFDSGALLLRGSGTGRISLVTTSPTLGTATFPEGTYEVLTTTTNQTITGAKTFASPTFTGNTVFNTASGTSLSTTGGITATGGFTGNLTGNVTGNASTATSFTNPLNGDVTGNQTATVVSQVGGQTAANIAAGVIRANTATSVASNNTIVARDINGDFSADLITATQGFVGNLSGNATTVTTIPNLSGEVTSSGNAVTLNNAAVIGKLVGGTYTTGTGAVVATDNLIEAIGKVEGNANLKAPINNPTFTGTVTIPSPFNLGITSVTTTGTQLNYLNLATGVSGTGSVVFTNSPTFTGTPTLPTGTIATTQTANNNSTAIATTAYVDAADNLKANIASPTFTGTPTLPTGTIGVTQAAGNNSTALATTAFVTTADNLKADLASPALSGTPTAPTAAVGTNTTQLATTAFVLANQGILKFPSVTASAVPAIAAGAEADVDYPAAGSSLTGVVSVSPEANLPAGLGIMSSRVSAAGIVTVRYRNFSAGVLSPNIDLNIAVIQ